MAAGLGFKDFTTGEVLTAADVDGYLMQGIWVFTNTTARDAAVTSPQEGNFAFTKDTNSLWYYDGAAWVASGATGDIEGVTAGIGISGGGTSGTVTITNSMATAIDAKGDLVAGTGADTFAKLTVGANATVLTADSSEATGLKWATPAGGSMTQLASGSLSGASVTLSSISQSYKDLVLFVRSFQTSGNTACGVQTNSDTSDYRLTGTATRGGSTYATLGSSATSLMACSVNTNPYGEGYNTVCYTFFNYTNSTTRKLVTKLSDCANSTNFELDQALFSSPTTAAITQLVITAAGTWDAGNYILYGVN